VLRSIIENNAQSGVEVLGSAAPTFLQNSFSANGVGIFISDNALPRFGVFASGGGNSLAGNTLCDFLHSGIQTIDIIGTRWDKDIFEFTIESSCSAGTEIAVNGAGSVNYQFIPPEDNLLFANTSRIPLASPEFGEVIFTAQPQFVWSSITRNISIVAVWDQPPVITANEVLDTVPIYWFWHSGLESGGNGFVQHFDGRSGSIEDPTPPRLFETGRSYYWGIWEWDETGRNIIASSSLSYFRAQ
jgi:hypothetical protein